MDKNIKEQITISEKLGHPVINAAAVISASGYGGAVGGAEGGVLAAILALLANVPAQQKFSKKIEDELNNIHEILLNHKLKLQKLNEFQYKIIKECINTLMRTEEKEKLIYLRKIISKTIYYNDYCSYDSILLSRIIRDISAEEIAFIKNNFSYSGIAIDSWNKGTSRKETERLAKRISDENYLLIYPRTPEELIVSGLINTGILILAEDSWGVFRYRFSEITVKLMVLVENE